MSEILPVTIIIQHEDDKLVPDSLVDKIRLDSFLAQVKKGQKLSMMLEVVTDDGTSAQLNYFHKLCRVISEDTGQAVDDQILPDGRRIHGVKSEAKIKAGLWKSKTELRSCSTFSKKDYESAIAGVVALGEDLGINLFSI